MKKLLVVLFVLFFVSPVSGRMLGHIETAFFGKSNMIEYIDTKVEGERSAAFRYTEEIRVVLAVVSFNTYLRRVEYESVRYLKDGVLHYVVWSVDSNKYVLTEAPIDLKDFWIKQLKKYVDGL